MTSESLKNHFETKIFRDEIKVLKNNNYMLSVENRALKSRIDTTEKKYEELQTKYEKLENNIEEMISKAVSVSIAKVTDNFNEIISQKEEQIKNLIKEIDRLKSQINKNSSNSSKPPSSNGLKKIIQNNREKSSNPVGGVQGHVGHKLELPTDIDDLIRTGKLERKIENHKDNKAVEYSEEYTVKYELDIEIKVVLTEHRYYKEKDSKTNKDTNASNPEHLNNEVYYGLGFKGISVLLSNEGLIANNRLKDFFSSISNGIINPSTATIIANNKLFAKKLEKTGQLEIIENNILNGEVLNVDDTGRSTTQILESDERQREDRKVFQGCIRTYSNELNTYLTFNSRKNNDGIIIDNILPRYHGILIHDHESKFRNYGDEGKHGDCHSHCNRELKVLFENLKVPFAKELRNFFNALNSEKKNLIISGINQMSNERLNEIDNKFDEIIQEGWEQIKPLSKEYGYNDAFNMLLRMEDYKDMYLLFVRNFKASYTNNLAERDLRHASIQENISGALRSYEGGQTYAKNRSFISTIKKRKLNIYESIKKIFNDESVLQISE